MQSSTQALQQFKQALAHVYQQWRDKQWEMMNIKLELPLFDAPVCASFLQMGEETVLEICDDDWDQLVGNSLAEEDSYHMAVQASRRIMWRPFCAEEAEVALFQQDGLQVFINDIHCGLLEVRPSSRWIEETRMLVEALSEILAAYNGPETTDEQWVEAAQLSDQSAQTYAGNRTAGCRQPDRSAGSGTRHRGRVQDVGAGVLQPASDTY